MEPEIISYREMCNRENMSLQRGMNFDSGRGYSVILMSVRKNAPYQDRFEDDTTLIYEGHDAQRKATGPDVKLIDQPERTPSGSLTQNGKFLQAASRYKSGEIGPALVRVYEKLKDGIWTYAGFFCLVDAWRQPDGQRQVFKFRLVAIQEDVNLVAAPTPVERRRVVPTHVKLLVWQRDGGKCVMCQSSDDLHFDHIIPWSKGGSSNTAENIQLLCARHNLQKRDHII